MFIALILLSLASAAQTKITGTVRSEDNNEALPGATVLIKNTTSGTSTNADGMYTIAVNDPDAVLIYSFVGYVTREIPVAGQSVIDVTLKSDINALEEIVVVGYGNVRKSDLTGSVSVVNADELNTIPAASPLEGLQGLVPGLQITNNSAAPGTSPTVLIRGVGTPGDPSPLFVVDGIFTNDISFLNAADIASISILKDASALAIYGNRGANGVIVVKTKQGKPGGVRLSVASSFGIQVQQRRIDVLNGREFAEVINAIEPGSFNNLNNLPSTDFQDFIFDPATIQTHTVSLSGASDKNEYYFSVGYFGQEGTIPEADFQRLTFRINETYKPNEHIHVGTNLTIAPFRQDNTKNDAPLIAYRASPIVAPYDADGNFNEVPGVGNVLADLAYNTDNKTSGARLLGQVFVEGRFLNGFTAKTSFSVEHLQEENESFVPVFFVSAAQQNSISRFNRTDFSRNSYLWENTLHYDKAFGKSRINALVGFTGQDVSNEVFEIGATGLFREGENFRFFTPGNVNAAGVTNGVRETDRRDFFNQISYLGRANYSYDDRYLATFTFRADGSSKFIGDNRYGLFPSAAVGWNISNEPAFRLPSFIANLKVRGSWGMAGNDKIDFFKAFSVIQNDLGAVLGEEEQVAFGQSDGAQGNPDLRWEEVEQVDIGLEIGLFDYRLTGEIDFYNRNTSRTLIDLVLPSYIGNGTNKVTFNAGEFTNSGLEFSFNWIDEKGDIAYNIGVQGTTIDNTSRGVSGVGRSDELLGFAEGFAEAVTRTAEGLPIGAFYGFQVDGVFQTQEEIDNAPTLFGTQPGDLIFRDVNEDGVLNNDDRTFIGSPIPDLFYGINLGIGYKGFDLSILFQGQSGNEIFNLKEAIRTDAFNFERRALDFWRGPGTSNTEPRPTIGGNNFRPSSRFIQDGSFFRLRMITLSYAIPEAWADKAKLNSAKIYLRGNNVFTLTGFTGFSPEISGDGPLTTGIDLGTFPVSSIYTIGIDLTL